MRTKVTFWIDGEPEDHAAIYDTVSRLGGYDVEIEEGQPDPERRPTGGRKKKPPREDVHHTLDREEA